MNTPAYAVEGSLRSLPGSSSLAPLISQRSRSEDGRTHPGLPARAPARRCSVVEGIVRATRARRALLHRRSHRRCRRGCARLRGRLTSRTGRAGRLPRVRCCADSARAPLAEAALGRRAARAHDRSITRAHASAGQLVHRRAHAAAMARLDQAQVGGEARGEVDAGARRASECARRLNGARVHRPECMGRPGREHRRVRHWLEDAAAV